MHDSRGNRLENEKAVAVGFDKRLQAIVFSFVKTCVIVLFFFSNGVELGAELRQDKNALATESYLFWRSMRFVQMLPTKCIAAN